MKREFSQQILEM